MKGTPVDIGVGLDYHTDEIDVPAEAATAIIAAPSDATKAIWIYDCLLLVGADCTGQFKDSDGTALTGNMPILASSGFSKNSSGNPRMPWLKVPAGKGVTLTMATASGTGDGSVGYAIVDPATWA